MYKFFLLTLLPLTVQAQQAVYRCEQGGKVGYSHEPCVGAKVIDATPTQGMDKMTGTSRKGASVRRDEHRQQLDEIVRPLTGLSHEQMNVERRRSRLEPGDKLRCSVLDARMPGLESDVAKALGTKKQEAEARLYQSRREFYWLKC